MRSEPEYKQVLHELSAKRNDLTGRRIVRKETAGGKSLPDGRGSVTDVMISRGLLSRDRKGAVTLLRIPKTVKHTQAQDRTGLTVPAGPLYLAF